ncbi:unnamed protein product [Durusdinium trenchii]|uniref:C3H1-type domain-containing protein n=1 Tax=Durusdinium trenchii TaxID=1381693 RepID=A0ABP0MEW4_9DINO
MRGDQCPYSHASQPAAKAKATSSTSAFGAKVPGAVAILTSTLTAAVASSSCTCLEFVGDAGAGECLGNMSESLRDARAAEAPTDYLDKLSVDHIASSRSSSREEADVEALAGCFVITKFKSLCGGCC